MILNNWDVKVDDYDYVFLTIYNVLVAERRDKWRSGAGGSALPGPGYSW